MKPERGQLVEIRFNNGVFFDAIVEDWSDQKSIVKLVDSGEVVIIQKTLQDVLLVKIITKKQEEQQQVKSEEDEYDPATFFDKEPNVYLGKTGVYVPGLKPYVVDNVVQSEFEELKNNAITPHSLNRMAELKNEMNQLDREELLGNMQTFKPSGVREVSYGIPRNIPISRATQHTEQEVAPTDSEFNSELQDLFDEEYQVS